MPKKKQARKPRPEKKRRFQALGVLCWDPRCNVDHGGLTFAPLPSDGVR